MDEPILALDLPPAWRQAFEASYNQLNASRMQLLLTTYFGALEDNTHLACHLPVAGLHIDLVRAPDQLDAVAGWLPAHKVLSVGVVDGRNVWRTDLSATLERLQPLCERFGERLWVGPSCSLLHTPVDLAREDRLSDEVRPWFAFAVQKVSEIKTLAQALAYVEREFRRYLECGILAYGFARARYPQLFTHGAGMASWSPSRARAALMLCTA